MQRANAQFLYVAWFKLHVHLVLVHVAVFTLIYTKVSNLLLNLEHFFKPLTGFNTSTCVSYLSDSLYILKPVSSAAVISIWTYKSMNMQFAWWTHIPQHEPTDKSKKYQSSIVYICFINMQNSSSLCRNQWFKNAVTGRTRAAMLRVNKLSTWRLRQVHQCKYIVNNSWANIHSQFANLWFVIFISHINWVW